MKLPSNLPVSGDLVPPANRRRHQVLVGQLMVTPSQRRTMAQWSVANRLVTMRVAFQAFGIHQTCYRYCAKLLSENVLIAD